MSVFPNFVALLLAILLSCPESEAANITAIISKAPSPSFPVEGKNLSLEWTYTLDGSIGVATFSIVNDDKSDSAIGSTFGPGTVTFLAEFQARFKAHVTETRAELTFLAVQRSDEGKTYKFSILTTKGGSISETWVLVVNFPPNITEISANQTAAEGENVTLKCLAYGKPTANNSWTRLSDNSVVNMPLTDIRRNDTGNYRCTADNGIGQPTIGDVFIDVQYPVEATGFGENATVPPGEKRTFYCPVVGNPKPNISWYRGTEESETPISTGEMLKAGLTGCYMCVASNSLGTSISITQCLTVEESSTASKTPTSPPRGPSPTVIGVLIGIAVFVIIMIGLVTWWMCKKNKCRKHTKNGERHYVEVAN